MAHISALNIYPVKSCRGIALERARITAAGFEHDREWMIVRPDGRFITQREQPRLALLRPTIDADGLQLHAPDRDVLNVGQAAGPAMEVIVWKDRCAAIDAGDEPARWLSDFLGQSVRLVQFDPTHQRLSDPHWTRGREAITRFTDGFPWMLLSQGSLDALNARLPKALPMNRFRPNIVIDGVAAFAEDAAARIVFGEVEFWPVKACARCAITTTDQVRGERDGDEPMRTLREFRFDAALQGVAFGQNLILASGEGSELAVGQPAVLNPSASH